MGLSTAVRVSPRAVPAPERAPAAHAPAEATASGNGSTAPQRSGETIEQCILRTLDQYFRDLGGARPHQLHEMVMRAVERPLLRFALERSTGNQSAASDLLGINRNTLRKKLIEHGLAEGPPPKPATRSAPRARKSTAKRKR
jgi:Fis family transcriptional regulator